MCVKPIPWPLKGPLGECVEGDPEVVSDGHVKAVKIGVSRLPVWKQGRFVVADAWSCLNCGCFWLEAHDNRESYKGELPTFSQPGSVSGLEIAKIFARKH